MFVAKRGGKKEPVHFDKITKRIEKLCYGFDENFIEPVLIAQKVVQGVYPGVTTSELDELAAETAAYMSTQHPDFSAILAARISMSNLHKSTLPFMDTVDMLKNYVHPKDWPNAPLIADDCYQIIKKNKERFESVIDYARDFSFDYFGFKTLERAYLLKINGENERLLHDHALHRHSQRGHRERHPYLRLDEQNDVHSRYTNVVQRRYLLRPQLASCFLLP